MHSVGATDDLSRVAGETKISCRLYSQSGTPLTLRRSIGESLRSLTFLSIPSKAVWTW
jgi:hypothetical protein